MPTKRSEFARLRTAQAVEELVSGEQNRTSANRPGLRWTLPSLRIRNAARPVARRAWTVRSILQRLHLAQYRYALIPLLSPKLVPPFVLVALIYGPVCYLTKY